MSSDIPSLPTQTPPRRRQHHHHHYRHSVTASTFAASATPSVPEEQWIDLPPENNNSKKKKNNKRNNNKAPLSDRSHHKQHGQHHRRRNDSASYKRQGTGFMGGRLSSRLFRLPKLTPSNANAATAIAPSSSASELHSDSDSDDSSVSAAPSSAPASTALASPSPLEGTQDDSNAFSEGHQDEEQPEHPHNYHVRQRGMDITKQDNINNDNNNNNNNNNNNDNDNGKDVNDGQNDVSSTPSDASSPTARQQQRRTPFTRRRRSAFVENRRTASWTGMLPSTSGDDSPYAYQQDEMTLPGELPVHEAKNVNEQIRGKWVPGRLVITSYQMRFFPENISTYDDVPQPPGSIVPLLMIHRIDKVGGRSTRQENTYLLEIHCKDLRMLRFSFLPARSERREVYDRLRYLTAPERFDLKAFCFQNLEFAKNSSPNKQSNSVGGHGNNNNNNNNNNGSDARRDGGGNMADMSVADNVGWRLYQPEREYKRQGVFDVRGARGKRGAVWRLTKVNQDFGMSATYPPVLCVPASITDDELRNVAAFRSKGRIPALSWLNARTGASLTRSSQPLSGLFRNSSKDDQKLMDAITECNGSVEKLLIIDLRPRANAEANRAMGMGYESASQYRRCELKFMNIDNIHTMRESYRKLTDLCLATGGSDPQWYSRLEATSWLEHIRTLLTTSRYIADCLEKEQTSVHVHCSDGWDRTSQVVGLASMMLDPYLRTIEGFAVMVEKDWLAFGHKFHTRCGHGTRTFFEDQRGPIFLQFIDAVHQILRQFPTSFEFNEYFLMFVMDQVYSCRFGTFIYDCWRERVQARVMEKTPSVWTYVLHNRTAFTNPFYAGNLSPTIIYSNTDHASLSFWSSYFLRYCRADEGCFAVSMVSRVLDARGMDLLREVAAMEDARRMEDARNEATVQTFQRELRSMWEAHEALQKENEILRKRTASSSSEWQSKYETDTNRLLALCEKQHAMLHDDTSENTTTESDTETDVDGDDTTAGGISSESQQLGGITEEETGTSSQTAANDSNEENIEQSKDIDQENLPSVDDILTRITQYPEDSDADANEAASIHNNSSNAQDEDQITDNKCNDDKTGDKYRRKALKLEQEMRRLFSNHPELRATYTEKS